MHRVPRLVWEGQQPVLCSSPGLSQAFFMVSVVTGGIFLPCPREHQPLGLFPPLLPVARSRRGFVLSGACSPVTQGHTLIWGRDRGVSHCHIQPGASGTGQVAGQGTPSPAPNTGLAGPRGQRNREEAPAPAAPGHLGLIALWPTSHLMAIRGPQNIKGRSFSKK